jgi:ProP effector
MGERMKIDPRPVIALLAERFPGAFFVLEKRRRPLKLGIFDDLIERLAGEICDLDLTAALGAYCANWAYLKSCREGADRLDLDGNPCGTVSAEHAVSARKRLDARNARYAAKLAAARSAASEKTPTPSPPPSPSPEPEPPKRLGLSDLRAAALARRGATS